MTPRPYTKEEMRQMFLEQFVDIVRYWQTTKTDDPFGGLIHSLMVLFDGGSGFFPAFDITPKPHPEDEEFCRQEGENWWVSEPINDDVQLHDMLPTIRGYMLDEEKLRLKVLNEFRNRARTGNDNSPIDELQLQDLMVREIIRLRSGK